MSVLARGAAGTVSVGVVDGLCVEVQSTVDVLDSVVVVLVRRVLSVTALRAP